MLVFVSDVHLTDGTSGTTMVPRAFDKLCRSLDDIIQESVKLKEPRITAVEIVLLRDIFDAIRSSRWLRPQNSEDPVRPWSDATLTDSEG